jgi:hypothetical protein
MLSRQPQSFRDCRFSAGFVGQYREIEILMSTRRERKPFPIERILPAAAAQLRDLAALEDWPPTSLFRRWAGQSRSSFQEGTVDALDASQLLYLRDYSSRHQVVIAEGDAVRFSNGGNLFANATDGQGGHAWASRDEAIRLAAPNWGASHSLPVARAPLGLDPRLATVSPERLAPKSGAAVVILDRTFEGPISAFGEKMSKAIRKAAADCGVPAKERPIRVSYHDRFARSPIVLRLLVDTVSGLAGGETMSLSIETASDKDSGFSWHQVASDITDNDMLDAFAGAYGDRRNLDVKLTVGQPPHKRSLILVYESDRKLTVGLDQGFGWLIYEGFDRSFDAGAAPQVAASRAPGVTWFSPDDPAILERGHLSDDTCCQTTWMASPGAVAITLRMMADSESRPVNPAVLECAKRGEGFSSQFAAGTIGNIIEKATFVPDRADGIGALLRADFHRRDRILRAHGVVADADPTLSRFYRIWHRRG